MRRLILASLLLFPVLAVSQDKDLDQALSRAAAYVETYTADLGGIVGDERYVQKGKWSCGGCNSAGDSFSEAARHANAMIDAGSTIMGDGIVVDPTGALPSVAGDVGAVPACGAATGHPCPEFGVVVPRSKSMAMNLLAYESRERTLLSEFRTTPVGDVWLGTRRVREVDGIAIDPSFRGRLAGNYDLSTFTGLLQLKKAIAYENARYTIGDFYFTTNIPTAPLDVLRRSNIAGYTFQKRGEEVVDTVRTWKVEATDRDGLLSAMFWIEPETGRILRTEFGTRDFVTRQNGPAMWTTVRYGFDAAVGMMVPLSMDEEYKGVGFLMGGQGHADYTNYRRFRADVRLVANAEDAPAAPGNFSPATTVADSTKVDDPSVTVDAWVTGNNGPVLNLKADDFVVTENKVAQTVTNFSPISVPYDVLLLFDRSGADSRPAYNRIGASSMQHAAQALIAGLQPQDRIGVAGFGSYFHMLTHWSDTTDQALKAFSQLSSFPDRTFFYRAIEHALISELPPVAGRRRALVVLTDGRDNRMTNSVAQLSHVTPSDQDPVFLEMIDVARHEHVPVYVVALNTDRNLMTGTTEDDVYVQLQAEYFFKGLLHPADKNLRSIPQDYLVAARTGMEQLAQASGGRIFFPKSRKTCSRFTVRLVKKSGRPTVSATFRACQPEATAAKSPSSSRTVNCMWFNRVSTTPRQRRRWLPERRLS